MCLFDDDDNYLQDISRVDGRASRVRTRGVINYDIIVFRWGVLTVCPVQFACCGEVMLFCS